MPADHVASLRRITEAIQRREGESVVDEIHPDAVLEPRRAVTEGAYLGRDGFRRYADDTAATFAVFDVTYHDLRDLGDGRVLALGTTVARGRESGAEMRFPTSAVLEYRDGLLYRYKDYGEPGLALEAAGLAAPS